MTSSNLCQGSDAFPFTIPDMASHAVYDPAQKKGGGFHHPIFNAVGTTSSSLSRATGIPSVVGSI